MSILHLQYKLKLSLTIHLPVVSYRCVLLLCELYFLYGWQKCHIFMDYKTLGHLVAQAEFHRTPGQSSIKPTVQELSWESPYIK